MFFNYEALPRAISESQYKIYIKKGNIFFGAGFGDDSILGIKVNEPEYHQTWERLKNKWSV